MGGLRRKSLTSMMAFIACCAFVFAMLRATVSSKHPEYVGSVVSTVTVALMAAATVIAFARTGRNRLSWAGFATFGWAYLMMCGKAQSGSATPFLVTDLIIHDFGNQIRFYMAPNMGSTPIDLIGHSVLAVLFGLMGVALGRSLGERPSPAPPSAP